GRTQDALATALASPSRRRRPPAPTLFPYTTLFRSRPVFLKYTLTNALVVGYKIEDNAAHTESFSLQFEQAKVEYFPSQTGSPARSEEHTSELQSLAYLVCRLLLEKKNHRRAPPPLL